jgi:hypothetical protein
MSVYKFIKCGIRLVADLERENISEGGNNVRKRRLLKSEMSVNIKLSERRFLGNRKYYYVQEKAYSKKQRSPFEVTVPEWEVRARVPAGLSPYQSRSKSI